MLHQIVITDWKFQWAEVLHLFWDSHQCQHSTGGLEGQQWFERVTRWNVAGTKNVFCIVTYTLKTPARLCEWIVKLFGYKTTLPFHMLRHEIQSISVQQIAERCSKCSETRTNLKSFFFFLVWFSVSHLLCTLSLDIEQAGNYGFFPNVFYSP